MEGCLFRRSLIPALQDVRAKTATKGTIYSSTPLPDKANPQDSGGAHAKDIGWVVKMNLLPPQNLAKTLKKNKAKGSCLWGAGGE